MTDDPPRPPVLWKLERPVRFLELGLVALLPAIAMLPAGAMTPGLVTVGSLAFLAETWLTLRIARFRKKVLQEKGRLCPECGALLKPHRQRDNCPTCGAGYHLPEVEKAWAGRVFSA